MIDKNKYRKRHINAGYQEFENLPEWIHIDLYMRIMGKKRQLKNYYIKDKKKFDSKDILFITSHDPYGKQFKDVYVRKDAKLLATDVQYNGGRPEIKVPMRNYKAEKEADDFYKQDVK